MASTSALRKGPAWRVAQWFWRGDAWRAARAEADAQLPLAIYEQRARIAAEVAQSTLEPSGAWLAGSASHLASALFIESIGWSLRLAAATRTLPATALLQPADQAELAQLVSTEHDLLLAAAGNAPALARVLESLLKRAFETRPLTDRESEQAARELGDVAHGLLRKIAKRRAAVETVVLQRAARMGALLLLASVCVVGGWALRAQLERAADLSAGKPWTTSSEYEVSCISPAHECGSPNSFFFSTKEEKNPWFEIDLGKPTRFSEVRIVNREDCCAERVAPLVVEASSDRSSWRELARKDEVFDTWTAKFSSTTARYVRLRVARRSYLHLHDVRVY